MCSAVTAMISQFSTPCTIAPFAGERMVSGVRATVELQVAWATARVGKWAVGFQGFTAQPQLGWGSGMVARWQQWMPFKIDAFRASSAVAMMHPAARAGYLYLLTSAWQSDDCTIPSGMTELAELSGLGDELWAVYGAKILRKFEPVGDTDRLRNEVCYHEWQEAKRIYERRKQAAEATNTVRSPHKTDPKNNGDRSFSTVTVRRPSRPADTRARVPARVPVPVDVSVSVNPENGGELSAAHHLLEELNVVADNGVRRVAADAIRLLAKEGGDIQTATQFILTAGREAVAAGEVINRFWFTDQRYRPLQPTKSRKQRDKEARTKAFLEAGNEGD
jgi:hypothetical protein